MSHWQSILQARTKYLPGQAYTLPQGSYGLDTPFIGNLEIDEGAMAVTFPFADGHRRDGVGDLLEIGGIDTSRHSVNPVTLFDHAKSVSLPIGKTEDPASNAYTVFIDPVEKVARAKAFFYQGKRPIHQDGYDSAPPYVTSSQNYDHAIFCEQIFDLMAKKFIRAGSIGYQVVAGRELPPDPMRGTPQGVHLLKTLLLEVSAVVLPANADTVGKALAMPKVCGKALSPMLVKALAPYAPARKVQIGYEGKAHPDSWGPDREKLSQDNSGEGLERRVSFPGRNREVADPVHVEGAGRIDAPQGEVSGPNFVDAGYRTSVEGTRQHESARERARSENRQIGERAPGQHYGEWDPENTKNLRQLYGRKANAGSRSDRPVTPMQSGVENGNFTHGSTIEGLRERHVEMGDQQYADELGLPREDKAVDPAWVNRARQSAAQGTHPTSLSDHPEAAYQRAVADGVQQAGQMADNVERQDRPAIRYRRPRQATEPYVSGNDTKTIRQMYRKAIEGDTGRGRTVRELAEANKPKPRNFDLVRPDGSRHENIGVPMTVDKLGADVEVTNQRANFRQVDPGYDFVGKEKSVDQPENNGGREYDRDGYAARLRNEPRESNPHPEGSEENGYWGGGWDRAHTNVEKNKGSGTKALRMRYSQKAKKPRTGSAYPPGGPGSRGRMMTNVEAGRSSQGVTPQDSQGRDNANSVAGQRWIGFGHVDEEMRGRAINLENDTYTPPEDDGDDPRAGYVYDEKAVRVPIPHGDLSKTKIPPAKWKPGQGAIKAIEGHEDTGRGYQGTQPRATYQRVHADTGNPITEDGIARHRTIPKTTADTDNSRLQFHNQRLVRVDKPVEGSEEEFAADNADDYYLQGLEDQNEKKSVRSKAIEGDTGPGHIGEQPKRRYTIKYPGEGGRTQSSQVPMHKDDMDTIVSHRIGGVTEAEEVKPNKKDISGDNVRQNLTNSPSHQAEMQAAAQSGQQYSRPERRRSAGSHWDRIRNPQNYVNEKSAPLTEEELRRPAQPRQSRGATQEDREQILRNVDNAVFPDADNDAPMYADLRQRVAKRPESTANRMNRANRYLGERDDHVGRAWHRFQHEPLGQSVNQDDTKSLRQLYRQKSPEEYFIESDGSTQPEKGKHPDSYVIRNDNREVTRIYPPARAYEFERDRASGRGAHNHSQNQ